LDPVSMEQPSSEVGASTRASSRSHPRPARPPATGVCDRERPRAPSPGYARPRSETIRAAIGVPTAALGRHRGARAKSGESPALSRNRYALFGGTPGRLPLWSVASSRRKGEPPRWPATISSAPPERAAPSSSPAGDPSSSRRSSGRALRSWARKMASASVRQCVPRSEPPLPSRNASPTGSCT
jgi:hypothetical protein